MKTKLQKHNCPHGKTKDVFSKWPNGDIFALFPEVPADINGDLCSSYEHCGQHGGADYFLCIAKSTPAFPSEYATLKTELEEIGYCLYVVLQSIPRDHDNRRSQI